MYTVVSNYAIDKKMEETKNWSDIKIICVRSMDMIRSTISNYRLYNMFQQQPDKTLANSVGIFEALEKIKEKLAVLEQRMSVLLDKLKKCNFLNLMLFYIDKYYQVNIVNKKSTVSVGSESVLSKEIIAAIDKVSMYAAVKFKTFVPTKYLKCFGISKEAYEEIRDFYFRYEIMNTPDNSVRGILENIYKRDPADFFILRSYFQGIRKYRNIEIYPCSLDHMNETLYSTKIKRMIEPWVPLQEKHTRYYLCVACGKWACPVVDPSSLPSIVNIFSLGKEKVSRDPFTDCLYCGKQVTSITIKNLLESRAYHYQGNIEDEGIAKAIRTHKDTINCSTVPLIYVRLACCIVSVGGKKFGSCSVCCQPTVFEGAKFGPNGFTCCFHESHSTKKIKGVQNKLVSNDPLIRARMEVGFNQKSENMIYCAYCSKFCEFGTFQVVKLMEVKEARFSEAILCANHYDLVKDIINVGNILFKDTLFEILSEATKRSVIGLIKKRQRRKRKDR
jgi:hypothetical protein